MEKVIQNNSGKLVKSFGSGSLKIIEINVSVFLIHHLHSKFGLGPRFKGPSDTIAGRFF